MFPCIRNRLMAWSMAISLSVAGLASAQTAPTDAPPMDPSQAINTAIRAIETGDLQTADRIIRDVSVTNPKLSRLHLATGMLMMELKRYTEAIEAFGRYNDTDEGRRDYRGWAAVGSVYMTSYMYSSAIGSLEKALDKVPPSEGDGVVKANIAIDLAKAQLGLNNRKDALDAIRTAEASASRNGEIQMEICELAARARDADLARSAGRAAVRAFQTELTVSPLSIAAHRGLVRCYEVLFSIQSAELSQHPNKGEAFIEGAQLLRSIAETERRIRLLDARSLVLQALESPEASAEWQLLAAELEVDLGATTEAGARVDAILEADPNNSAAKLLKSRLSGAGG